jgi:hypothetical protein
MATQRPASRDNRLYLLKKGLSRQTLRVNLATVEVDRREVDEVLADAG